MSCGMDSNMDSNVPGGGETFGEKKKTKEEILQEKRAIYIDGLEKKPDRDIIIQLEEIQDLQIDLNVLNIVQIMEKYFK